MPYIHIQKTIIGTLMIKLKFKLLWIYLQKGTFQNASPRFMVLR